MKLTVTDAIRTIAKPINELVRRLRAAVPLSGPVAVTYCTPAMIIDITATKPPNRKSISKIAKPIDQVSSGKVKLVVQAGGDGGWGKNSHQFGKKKNELLQLVAAAKKGPII
jgi:hypothetical protein